MSYNHSSNNNKKHGQRQRTEDYSKYEYGKKQDQQQNKSDEPIIDKEKPNLGLSGNLTKDTNTFNGVVVKYNQPPEARLPKKRWRLYCFKGDEELPFYPMHRQTAYLFGRDRLVADIPIDHPSCSKQHAVFQYRLVEYKRKDGTTGRIVKPYIIDLASTNGTFINSKQIEAQRYFELREKDVLKFGLSTREYVLLHEESKGNDLSDLEYEDDGDEDPKLDEKRKESSDKSKTTTIKQERPSPPPTSSMTKSAAVAASRHKLDDSSSSGDDSSDDDNKRSKLKKHKSSHNK